uniref:Uncharacterized protein n=1 Tax=Arundo donax TaxID=35708 RepID=A0A0A9FFW8_ARUDO
MVVDCHSSYTPCCQDWISLLTHHACLHGDRRV